MTLLNGGWGDKSWSVFISLLGVLFEDSRYSVDRWIVDFFYFCVVDVKRAYHLRWFGASVLFFHRFL